jgi:hypothetical protein
LVGFLGRDFFFFWISVFFTIFAAGSFFFLIAITGESAVVAVAASHTPSLLGDGQLFVMVAVVQKHLSIRQQ